MSKSKITVVDYGMGNLWSVISALTYLGCDVSVSSHPNEIINADALILPGVGSFRKAMNALSETGLDQAIIDVVQAKGRKVLGICLGMQLLGLGSTEDGQTSGLGLIKSMASKFTEVEVSGKKIPHVGFDSVFSQSNSLLFKGLGPVADFYFVHSYRMLPVSENGISSVCDYGVEFLAAYEHDNVFATQFHPEKSQTNGLLLLKNFLDQ